MISLSERLQKIADAVGNESVADIGTDHGYIPIYLSQRGQVKKIIVTDINKGPIEIAKKNIKRYISDKNIESRIGNGLEIIKKGEVDTVVIAGMGGLLIRDILKKDIAKTKSYHKLILQPRNAEDKLRKWLEKNGFKICDEFLAREGRYICEIIVVALGEMKITQDIYYEIGYQLIEKKDPLLEPFIQRKINIEKKIIAQTQNIKSEGAQKQKKHSLKRINRLEEVLKNVCSKE